MKSDRSCMLRNSSGCEMGDVSSTCSMGKLESATNAACRVTKPASHILRCHRDGSYGSLR